MITVLVTLIVGTAGAGVCGFLAVRRLPRLSAQLAALALFAVVLPLVSVSLSGVVMLHRHDAVEVLVICSVAAVVISLGAVLIARGITRPLRTVHDAAVLVAGGELGTRIDVTGPTELAEVAAAFNTMAESVQRTFDARSDFIAWASHDLRSPVASLQAMIEAIEDGLTPPERYLPAISARIGDLARLVEDLFDYARTELEPNPHSLVVTDAVAVANRAVTTHQPQAATQQVTITLHSDLPELLVTCAATDLTRILDNLMANALHHTPAGGTVDVVVHRDGTLTITDTGPGFPPDSLQRAFEPFWRGDQSRHGTGAGLGLAIARGLITRNAGSLQASNAPGARLTLTCRRASPAEVALAGAAAALPGRP